MQKKRVFATILIILAVSIISGGCVGKSPRRQQPWAIDKDGKRTGREVAIVDKSPGMPDQGSWFVSKDVKVELVIGKTTRKDIESKLGAPDAFYSSEYEYDAYNRNSPYEECTYNYMRYSQENVALAISITSSDKKRYTYLWKGRNMRNNYMVLTFRNEKLTSVDIN